MKKPIVLLLLILCFFLIPVSSSAAAASTYEDYAECLSDLGVFVGTGNGFELDRAPTRIEGLIMLIRLLGAEEEAKAMNGKELPFTDVPKWALGYVAYAYENGLTNGIGKDKFGSSDTMEAKAYLTFLLRSLGYNDQAGDFSYGNALAFSKSVGLLSDSMYSTLSKETFIRAFVAKTSYDALRFSYKGGSTLLIDKLVAEKKIDQATGDAFKKAVLTEPSRTSIPRTAPINVEANMESVVMLSCYTDYYDEEYGPDIGSGVILSTDGRIVTNYHVLEDAYKIEITFNDESVYQGDIYIVGYDEDLDLAILKIDKSGLKPATIGDSSKVKTGDSVVAIGSPYGLINTVTEGIVSAIRSDSIQISSALNPGNSGGGLFDEDGRLIGIPYSTYFMADNMGFAIPINQLSSVTENKNILLKDYYSMNAEPLPPAPTGLHLVYETDTTVLLNWNPVADADCYYVYGKGEMDEDYEYLGIAYYGTAYSYLAVELTPGEEYSFKVSVDRDDQESQLSTALTFTKASGIKKHSSFDLFYQAYPGIPDFGRLCGINPYKTEKNEFFYKFDRTLENASMLILDYGYLLEECGFTYVGSTRAADGTATETCTNGVLNKTLIMTGKPLSDEEYMVSIRIE